MGGTELESACKERGHDQRALGMSFGAPADFRWATQTCALRWNRNHSLGDELHPHALIWRSLPLSFTLFTRCSVLCTFEVCQTFGVLINNFVAFTLAEHSRVYWVFFGSHSAPLPIDTPAGCTTYEMYLCDRLVLYLVSVSVPLCSFVLLLLRVLCSSASLFCRRLFCGLDRTGWSVVVLIPAAAGA